MKELTNIHGQRMSIKGTKQCRHCHKYFDPKYIISEPDPAHDAIIIGAVAQEINICIECEMSWI